MGILADKSRLSGAKSGLSGLKFGLSPPKSGLSGRQSGRPGQMSGLSGLSGQMSGLSGPDVRAVRAKVLGVRVGGTKMAIFGGTKMTPLPALWPKTFSISQPLHETAWSASPAQNVYLHDNSQRRQALLRGHVCCDVA